MSNPLPKRPKVSSPKQPNALSSRRLFVTGVLFFLALLLLDLLLIFTDYSPPCLVNAEKNLTIVGFSLAQLSLLTHWFVFGRGWFLIRGSLLLSGTSLLAYLNSDPTLTSKAFSSFSSQLALYGIYGTFLLIFLYLIYYWFSAFQPKKNLQFSIKQILGWTTFVAFFLSLTKIANLSIVNDLTTLSILALLSTPALLFPLFLFRKKRFLLHLFLLTLYGIVLCLILPLLINIRSDYRESFFIYANVVAPIYLLLSSWYAARNYALKTNPHYLKSDTALQATRQTASPTASAAVTDPASDPTSNATIPFPTADPLIAPADPPVDYEA